MKFLSFDCATKTFAFSCGEINIDEVKETLNNIIILENEIQHITSIEKLIIFKENIYKIKKKIKSFITLDDGETIDLFPGIDNEKIDIVSRLRALVNYVKSRIPNQSIDTKIFIEFQMGQNPKARAIVSSLITLFYEHEIIIVNPSLKNKIYLSDDGRYCHFIKKYSSNYIANKEHCKYNFNIVEIYFNSKIPYSNKRIRGHIADSFMQVLGHLKYGKKYV